MSRPPRGFRAWASLKLSTFFGRSIDRRRGRRSKHLRPMSARCSGDRDLLRLLRRVAPVVLVTGGSWRSRRAGRLGRLRWLGRLRRLRRFGRSRDRERPMRIFPGSPRHGAQAGHPYDWWQLPRRMGVRRWANGSGLGSPTSAWEVAGRAAPAARPAEVTIAA